MATKFQKLMLTKLVNDRDYFRHVIPYIKQEYFDERVPCVVFELIEKFSEDYKKAPTKEVLQVEVEAYKGLGEDEHKEVVQLVKEMFAEDPPVDRTWLTDETEKYCQNQAIFNAIAESVGIIDGKDKKKDVGMIPKMLSDALAISFDKNIGHDYFEDAEARWDWYNRKEAKLPSLIKILDDITDGGIPKKTLNMFMATQNAGKSAAMCSLAANYISQGQNVLYITLELSEEAVAERIDANLLNIPTKQVRTFPKDIFCKKLGKIQEKSFGKLKIKQYPTGTASAQHFRTLLDEYERKQGFKPDVIFIDYLGITASAFYKAGTQANSYTIGKSVAEELRALAVEKDCIVWTAVQGNRGAMKNSDMDETNIAESIGILMTADFVLGLIRTEQLDELGHVLCKQIKSRYGDTSYFNRFILGFDRPRMRLHDVEDADASSVQRTTSKYSVSPEEEELETIANKARDAEMKSKIDAAKGWSFG